MKAILKTWDNWEIFTDVPDGQIVTQYEGKTYKLEGYRDGTPIFKETDEANGEA